MVDKNIKTFKERWDEVDERCPTCGNVTKEIVVPVKTDEIIYGDDK